MAQQARYVLENKNGQVVRVFAWDNDALTLVYREDTRRVEACANTKELKDQDIPFEVLVSSKRTQVAKKPLEVKGVGRLRLINSENENFSPNYTLAKDESEEKFKTIFIRSAVAQLAVCLVLIGLGLLFGKDKNTDTTVTVIPQEQIEKMLKEERTPPTPPKVAKAKPKAKTRVASRNVVKPKVVAPMTRKNQKPQYAKTKARGGYKGPGKMGYGTNEPNMNSMGALNALNKVSKSAGNGGRGGTNLAAVGNGRGSGAGGRGYGGFGKNGSGGRGAGGIGNGTKMGLANSMYGKGLIATPIGEGSGAPGYGGYGTKGRAGGGEAGVGYGRTSLVGSSKGLGPKGNGPAGSGGGGRGYGWAGSDEDDMVVQGGLDSDQIAEVILRNMGQIRYCYEQGLQTKPELSGRVAVRFMIGGRGKVTTAGVAHSSLRSSKVESCIVNKLQAWNFPRPIGGVTVKVLYPFILRRVGAN